MAFGFPAYARGSRQYDFSSNALQEAVARALNALGWTPFGNWSGRRFVAEIGVSVWSWGEKVNVKIDCDGTIWFESKCRLPTQCIDWGKNQRNVKAFFHLVEEKSRHEEKE